MDSAACYRVLQARDARFDGHFFTGVHSTGIYCRPVCKVRIPMGKNAFFCTPHAGGRSGFSSIFALPARTGSTASAFYRWSMPDAGAALVRQAFQLLNLSKALIASNHETF